jgi:hypothetical protein
MLVVAVAVVIWAVAVELEVLGLVAQEDQEPEVVHQEH